MYPATGRLSGVDVGIKVLAFTSDGEEYHNRCKNG